MAFAIALSETEIQKARGASRGNRVLGATDADSLSLRFGLQSMYFLTNFFADRRERAPSKRALQASLHGLFLAGRREGGTSRNAQGGIAWVTGRKRADRHAHRSSIKRFARPEVTLSAAIAATFDEARGSANARGAFGRNGRRDETFAAPVSVPIG